MHICIHMEFWEILFVTSKDVYMKFERNLSIYIFYCIISPFRRVHSRFNSS